VSRQRLAALHASAIGPWVVAALLGIVAFQLADHAYRTLPRPQPLSELSYYPSGRWLAPATLGHAETAADLAWLRAVQYYGEHRLHDNTFVRLSHVFDILTTLSPGFIEAYVFGGFALAQEGGDFARAEALMLKGIAANPASGRLAFELGFLYYVRPGGRDLRNAAAYFAQAARQPDAPPQALRFAAFARQSSGDLRVAYELWQAVYERSPNAYMRDMAEREMRGIREAIEAGRHDRAIRKLTTPMVRVERGH
jgi:Flp pilus assembly protein TadD